MPNKPRLEETIQKVYSQLVSSIYPDLVHRWPIITGFNNKVGGYGEHLIFIFEHTGNPGMVSSQGVGELSSQIIGYPAINETNIDSVRLKIEEFFDISLKDGVVILKKDLSNLDTELNKLFDRHKIAMGVASMKIFLSHKGIDKPRVRDYKETLISLGLDPWLDEDAMVAGTELERGILKGFQDSCAAVFFVTPNFKDEDYLSSEVNYAIAEKRKKGERFVIITLVFNENNNKGTVPDLLRPYVWKEPKTDLEALREILKSIPLQLGKAFWKF